MLSLYKTACPGNYDVIVILDVSQEVGRSKYARFKQLVKDILHFFDIGTKKTNFGLLTFNTKAKVSLWYSLNN